VKTYKKKIKVLVEKNKAKAEKIKGMNE